METFLILALILLVSQTVEAVSGFGSTVIAVTIGVHFLDLETLVPVLVLLNLFLSGYIVIRHFQHIDRRVLLHRILPTMSVGLVLGVWIFSAAEGPSLRTLLGSLVMVLSGVELAKLMLARSESPRQPLPRWLSTAYLLGAGMMHGIYASGGPLLVYVTSRLPLSKTVFRSTLASVWLTLNISLTFSYIFTQRITPEVTRLGLFLLPTLPFGLILGEWLHHRVDEKTFRVMVYILLMVAGAALLIP
jgi:uncharacterized membrane protein YfcA